jgi:translation elongation factor TU
MSQVVVGTAGHIDHGKTSLVKALTGTNTDRLKEEKIRGMTIDIGFAFLDENITLIDVPGHEKFVKNMMAGVSGIDVALLVVAADDGVMPQTREHFEILSLLDISAAVIAINKIDLADEDWLELIELDLAELVSGTFMENAPMIRVSAESGDGIIELRDTLLKICDTVPDKQDRGIFRLHVDRVFSIKGYGTVATGTVNSGLLKTSENVEIIPGGVTARVRGLQSHGSEVNSVILGDRAAINLQGVGKNDIDRGSQLATPGYFKSVTQMGVKLNLLRSATKSVIQNQRIRIHLGTQETMARIALIGNKTLEPGGKGLALLRLESPLVAAREDKFIVPVATVPHPFILNTRSTCKRKIPRSCLSGTVSQIFNRVSLNSIIPSPLSADTLIIGAFSINVPLTSSARSSSISSSQSSSAKSILLMAITAAEISNRLRISKCSRVWGITPSSAATTSRATSMPETPAIIFFTNFSCPGTSIRVIFSSRNAKPISMVIPRIFSSASRSVLVPVKALTRDVLPWSI